MNNQPALLRLDYFLMGNPNGMCNCSNLSSQLTVLAKVLDFLFLDRLENLDDLQKAQNLLHCSNRMVPWASIPSTACTGAHGGVLSLKGVVQESCVLIQSEMVSHSIYRFIFRWEVECPDG